MALCVSCGKELKDGARFCPYCGAGQPLPSPEPPAPREAPPVPSAPLPQKKKSKAPLIVGIVLAAAVLIAGLALLVFFVILPRLSPAGAGTEDGNAAAYGIYGAVSAEAFGNETPPDGEWIELQKDGKGILSVAGREYPLTWELDGEEFSGTAVNLGLKTVLTGTLIDGVLKIRYGNYAYVMRKDVPAPPVPSDTGSEPASETDPAGTDTGGADTEGTGELDLDLIARYEGDWIGAVQFYHCSGAYAEHDFVLTDAILRLSFAPDGSVIPYLRLNLKGFESRSGFDSSAEANNFRDLSARLDPDAGSLILSGHFFSGALSDPTCAVSNENGSLTISMTVTADDGSFDIYLVFRRPGDAWSDGDDPRLTDDGAAYYSELSLAEIAKEFGLNPSLIPEASDIADFQKEGAPVD